MIGIPVQRMGGRWSYIGETLLEEVTLVLPRCLIALVCRLYCAEIVQVDLPEMRFWSEGRGYNTLLEAYYT
jgi:hypothetical protein